MRILLFCLIGIFSILHLAANDTLRISAKNADFQHAIFIKTSNKLVATAPIGGGKHNEIQSEKGNKYFFEKEHNTVWFRFKADDNCFLNFEISPFDAKDDYDFVLFRLDEKSDSLDILANKKLPIRSNISRNNAQILSKTGLKLGSDTSFVGFGVGEAFSRELKVEKNQEFVLVIDNVYGGGSGFSLEFFYSNCDKPKNNYSTLNARIFSKETNELIDAKLSLIKLSPANLPLDTLFEETVSTMYYPLEPNSNFALLAYSMGYFKKKIEFQTDSISQIIVKDFFLDSIFIGKKLTIENLYFNPGTADILRKSFPTLRELLQTMKDNPQLVIEIQGHVNDPYTGSARNASERYQALSEARAKSVFDYLAKRGIQKDRMTYTGFGNTKMLFPKAITEAEMEQNRRVEIEIIAF